MDKESKLRAKIANDFWYSYQNSSSISSVYQQIREIIISLTFKYDESQKEESIKVFKPTDKAFFQIECINRDCIYGGFNLSNEINGLISKGETDLKGHQACKGYQDYERYRAKNFHCLCRLDYKIVIKYFENE